MLICTAFSPFTDSLVVQSERFEGWVSGTVRKEDGILVGDRTSLHYIGKHRAE